MSTSKAAPGSASGVTSRAMLTVRGFHLDGYGHVNNARYLEFYEEGRWGYMLAHLDLADLKREGIAMVAVNVNLDWSYPATVHDELLITTRLSHVGRRKMIMHQEIHLGEHRMGEVHPRSGVLVSRADFTFVLMNTASGRAMPLDGEIADMLRPLVAEEEA
ncbi:acyl-CoA thioesterase [Cobetia sp. L2A1]|uniref:acyl-CoA thioesterase n=1 Tax=Cobetia sp. L2A1 TaxID=2686360 RepID=UPI00131B312E|nr:thioesterase family protein [Cobetia sp. L2A1]